MASPLREALQATLEALGLSVTVNSDGAGWLATACCEGLTARQSGESPEAALLALLVYFGAHPLESAPPLGVVLRDHILTGERIGG